MRLIKESNTWDLAKLYLFTPAGSNPETQFDVGDEVVVIIDYGAKLDAKFGMRLKSCVYDGLNVINCKYNSKKLLLKPVQSTEAVPE